MRIPLTLRVFDDPNGRSGAASVGSARLRVGLRSARIELEADHRLATRDPRIVSRFDHVRVARPKVLLRSVVVNDVHTSRNDRPDVVRLTTRSASNRLDAFR